MSDGSAAGAVSGELDVPRVLAQLHARAALVERLAQIHAVPMCVAIRKVDRLVDELATATGGYRGVFLASMASPRCLIVREQLGNRLAVPVIHEAHEPAAAVLLAAVYNALAIVGTPSRHAEVVVVGTDATQLAIANLLHAAGIAVTLVTSETSARLHLEIDTKYLGNVRVHVENAPEHLLAGADVLIAGELPISLDAALARMAPRPVVLLLDASPARVHAARARAMHGRIAVLATRSPRLPNRLDWALASPGVLRALLDVGTTSITWEMQIAAARALAQAIEGDDSTDRILPVAPTSQVTRAVAEAVRAAHTTAATAYAPPMHRSASRAVPNR